MSTTTIAVKSETLKLLHKVKEELNADSFNTVIETLLLEAKKPKRSKFGVLSHVKKEFRREEIDRFS